MTLWRSMGYEEWGRRYSITVCMTFVLCHTYTTCVWSHASQSSICVCFQWKFQEMRNVAIFDPVQKPDLLLLKVQPKHVSGLMSKIWDPEDVRACQWPADLMRSDFGAECCDRLAGKVQHIFSASTKKSADLFICQKMLPDLFLRKQIVMGDGRVYVIVSLVGNILSRQKIFFPKFDVNRFVIFCQQVSAIWRSRRPIQFSTSQTHAMDKFSPPAGTHVSFIHDSVAATSR